MTVPEFEEQKALPGYMMFEEEEGKPADIFQGR